MKHYPHHIGDFDKATRHLTRIERSVYRDLIDLYYDSEARLPLDKALLCRKILARSNEESTAVAQVLSEFFTETPTGWYHDRCEAEIEAYHSNTSQKAMAGKASAEAKRLKKLQALNGELTSVEQPLKSVETARQQNSTNHQPINQSTNQPMFIETTSLADNLAVDRPPQCPTEKIVDLYHRHLPMCPRVEVMSDTRKKSVSARWRQIITDKEISQTKDPKQSALEYFDWYFAHAAKSAFLSGRAKDWKADFDFLMNATKFVKVVEGHYHKEKA